MPRLAISLEVVDDENHTIHTQRWSPLGYADFNNPALLQEDPNGAAVNAFELHLLERLRVAIDRSLMRFAHGERRRNTPPTPPRPQYDVNDFAGPYDYEEAIAPHDRTPTPDLLNGLTQQQQIQLSRMRIDPDALVLLREQVPDSFSLIREQCPKEDEPLRKPEPKPVARKSRYQRDPVI